MYEQRMCGFVHLSVSQSVGSTVGTFILVSYPDPPLVSSPDPTLSRGWRRARAGHKTNPPPKRKGGSGEYSAALHCSCYGFYYPLELLAGLQQIGGVLSRSVNV